MAASLIRPDLVEGCYGAASNLAFNERIKALMKQGDNIYHFGFGQSPFPPLGVAEAALKAHSNKTEYLSSQGLLALREEIASFHRRHDQLITESRNIIVGPGSKELIFHIMLVFNGEIYIPSPAWTTYKPQAMLAGREVTVIHSKEENNWKITARDLDENLSSKPHDINKMLIFNNPCNPSGSSYTEQELQDLTEVFRKHRVIVVSDEIYARLKYDRNHVCLANVYPEGTVLSSGFSKWASLGGYRLGYHIFPEQLRTSLLSTLISVASHSFSCAPTPMQFGLAEALTDHDSCDDYIRHSRRILHEAGAFSSRTLRSAGVKVVEPSAGYYIFPNFEVVRPALAKQGIKTCQHMCDLLLSDCSVAVLPGGPDHLRESDELTVRLCFICFDGEKAMAESRRIGLQQPLGDRFVQDYCTNVYNGISALTRWVQRMTSTS